MKPKVKKLSQRYLINLSLKISTGNGEASTISNLNSSQFGAICLTILFSQSPILLTSSSRKLDSLWFCCGSLPKALKAIMFWIWALKSWILFLPFKSCRGNYLSFASSRVISVAVNLRFSLLWMMLPTSSELFLVSSSRSLFNLFRNSLQKNENQRDY